MPLQVKQLTKIFDQHQAVDQISFSLTSGNCIALLGANGAGKTTTLRMLSGLLKPSSGSISFNELAQGKDIREFIGYLPQYPVFHNWMSGREFLIYVGKLGHLSKEQATKRADQLLERVGIAEQKNKRIGKYSGGMKQRLGIAQALIHKPKLIMLDEPVSSLDPIGRREILSLLADLKNEITILFSTHILNDAEAISDEIILMHKGKIIEQGLLCHLREKYQTRKIELHFKPFDHEEIQKLDKLPSVLEVTPHQEGVTCLVEDTEIARQAILELAIEQHWPLSHFSIGKMTLEDMFMEVIDK
ncbi:ABC transporter ATP-binding protein [Amphibacillus cookii]|uniref:ABC transporter ATP-binding protein n=1 Tax=Amphibacillus cookii TaxID=767787 RepID=UPI00195EF140|nr:ABC transporter ATP-binding protein [Amphibacillus cookii]MBM7542127.1 ABC-2 type transport system ATP-binding protein [Amphibacillus cookii]